MKLSKKNLPLIIAAIVVVGGVVAYFLWLRPVPQPNVSVAGYGPASEAQATFLTLAAQLEPVGFNASVLSDPRLLMLVDLKTAIVQEPEGRTDPFAPLPGIATQ